MTIFPRALAGVAIVGLMTACGPARTEAPSAGVTSASKSEPFAAAKTEQLLGFGLMAIEDRFIDPVELEEVAVSGLAGLAALQPSLSATREGNSIVVRDGGRTVAALTVPADDGPLPWAHLMTRALASIHEAVPQVAGSGRERLHEAVFGGMLKPLDRFSRYAGRRDAGNQRANRNGYGGIGVRYRPESCGLLVERVQAEGPAAKAGVEADDCITHVDGKAISGLSKTVTARELRGPIGSELELTVIRESAEDEGLRRSLRLRRALVVPQTVELELRGTVAHIRLTRFNQRTARSLAAAVGKAREALGPALSGAILDMRGNPGGLLDQAVETVDLFVDDGVIVTTEGRHRASMQRYSARPGDILKGLPLVVLVDGRSASSAEIVAAALQDSDRAVVVGSNSYGKGTVQTVIPLPNDGELTLTWSRFHSPDGYALHGLGVLPEVCVADDDKAPELVLTEAERGYSADVFRHWRQVPVRDKAARQDLRKSCPPVNHADWAVDETVALRLLADRDRYSATLRNNARMATVSN